MKMARARDTDFAAIDALHNALQCFCCSYQPRMPDKEGIEGNPLDDDEVPEELGRFVRDWWDENEGSWNRVTFGAKILIDNVCDPDKNYLDWKPKYKAAIEAAEVAESTTTTGA